MVPGIAVGSAILLAVATGGFLLRRAFARAELLPEEVALAAAWVFVVGSLVWLEAFLSGRPLLGFDAPWTWITASHFVTAGFGAITVTALTSAAQRLPGHEPVTRPITRGSGHLDVVVSFTTEQLAQLARFSVCFTGPGTPDPNPACTFLDYDPD